MATVQDAQPATPSGTEAVELETKAYVPPEYVQQLSSDQKQQLQELCALDDEYLKAAEEMRSELRRIQKNFEQTVQKAMLERRREKLDSVKLPEFWSRAMQHSHVKSLVEEWDLPVLASLRDIVAEPFEDPEKGWKLHFHFDENEYFENKVLTKTYHTMRESKWDVDLDTVKIESTKVSWKERKNVTMDVKTKGKGNKKKTVAVPRDSFFRFFYPLGEGAEFPPEVPNEDESDDEELDDEERMEGLINDDVVYAEALRDLVIPHAVRHYTAEAVEMESDDDESDEEEEVFETPQKTTAPARRGQTK